MYPAAWLLGGLLALDGTSVGQTMASRPLAAGYLAGLVAGDPVTGVTVGAFLELYLLAMLPSGGARFPEGSIATVVAVFAAVPVASAPGALPLAVGVALVWGKVCGRSIEVLRHVNGRLVPDPEEGPVPPSRIERAHLAAVALDLVRGMVLTAAGLLAAGPLLAATASRWPLEPDASAGFLLAGGAVSAGIVLRSLTGAPRRRLAFVAGLAVGVAGGSLL